MIVGRTGWLIALLVALIASLISVFAVFGTSVFGTVEAGGVVGGWVVAGVSSAAAFVLNRRAIGVDAARFMWYGLLGNGIRFLAVIGIAAAGTVVGGHVPFAISLVISYLVLMAYEIGILYTTGLKSE